MDSATAQTLKNAVDECLVGNFSSLKTLDIPFDEIIEGLQVHYDLPNADIEAKKKFSKDRGRLFELVFKTGAFLKCPTLAPILGKDTVVYEDLKPCRSFDYKSGWKGMSDEWGADVIVLNKATDVVWAWTAKSRQNITLSATEWRNMLNLDRNLEFQNKDIAIGFIVNDRNEFMSNRSTQLGNYNYAITDTTDLNAMWDECRAIFQDFLWDLHRLAESVRQQRIPYKLMPHQVDGENQAYNAFMAGKKEFLLFWKCRAGKTLAALDLLYRKMGLRNVLLLTSYPSVNPEWVDTVKDFMGFDDIVTHNVSGDKLQYIGLHPTKKNLVIVSMQDAVVGEVEDGNEWAKAKFSNLEGLAWDAIILDEVHHGQETQRAIAVKNRIQYRYCLALSATPWKNIALGRFGRHNTHEWSIVDEGVAKAANPAVYGKYPSMQFFIWEIDAKIRAILKEEYDEAEYPTMTKLFRVEKGRMYHENLIRKIFQNWRIKISERGINPQNMLAFLPSVKGLEPLCAVMAEAFPDYEVGYTSSQLNPTAAGLRAFRDGLYARAKAKGKVGTIILAVAQLTTGVTLKQCDCILHLDDDVSTALYIQKSLRAQNPGENKTTCYIFDFNPNRALKCILTTAIGSHTQKPQEERVREFLLNAAVQLISEGKWEELTAEYLIKRGVEAQLNIDRSLFNRGIINDDILDGMTETDLYRQLVELPYEDAAKQEHSSGKPNPIDPEGMGPGKNQEVVDSEGKSNYTQEVEVETPVVFPDLEDEVEKPGEPKKPTLTMKQKIERLTVNFSWLPALTRFQFLTIEEIIAYLETHDEEREEFEKLLSRIDEKTTYPITLSYVKRLLDYKRDGRYLLDREELNKRLYCLVMDCRDNPGRANELMISDDQYKKIFGEVFTPKALVDEMLDKLPVELWGNKELKWCDPACGSGNFLYQVKLRLMDGLAEAIPDEEEREKHIVEKMLYGVELQRKNTYLCMFKIDPDNKLKTHIVCEDSLKFDFWGMKFDVVLGNPPYQDEQKGKGKLGSKALWVRFVNLALDSLLKDGGYLCFVHPSKWRKYEDELWEKMTSRQILHLDIHGYKDGQRTFGAATRYDWYVLENTPAYTTTTVRDEENVSTTINIKDWTFIPNFAFDEVKKLLGDKEKVVALYSRSLYGTDKTWMSKTQDETYRYPCVYMVNRKNEPTFWYCSYQKDFFIPKVIFGGGATGFIVDATGEYGLTQFATGIVDDVENLPKIVIALDTPEFKRIIQATSMSKAELDRKILGLFKKDFWKEFITEDEN